MRRERGHPFGGVVASGGERPGLRDRANQARERERRGEHAAAPALWTRYVAEWTTWNHVRTAAALAAAAAFTIALAY